MFTTKPNFSLLKLPLKQHRSHNAQSKTQNMNFFSSRNSNLKAHSNQSTMRQSVASLPTLAISEEPSDAYFVSGVKKTLKACRASHELITKKIKV